MRSRRLLFAFLFLAGLSILGLLIYISNPVDVLRALKSSRRDLLILALLAYLIESVLWTERWRFIMRDLGVRASFTDVIKALFLGKFFNNITPGARMGGEPFRAAYISAKYGNAPEVSASVVIDRIVDTISFLSLFLFFSLLYLVEGGSKKILPIVILAVLITLSMLGVGTYGVLSDLPNRIARFIIGKIRFLEDISQKIFEGIEEFKRNVRSLAKKKSLFLKLLALSIPITLSSIARFYFILSAILGSLELDLRLLSASCIILMFPLVLSVIQIFPGGLGMYEMLAGFMGALVGVSLPRVTSAILLDRGLTFWLTNALVLPFIMIRGRGLLKKLQL